VADIPVLNMLPGAQFDFSMPDWTKALIADCIIIFGRVEQKAIEIVWVVEKSTGPGRARVAKRKARQNFAIAVKNKAGTTDAKIEEHVSGFNDLSNLRNLMAHGAWVMVNGVPWVVWHKFIVDDGSVVGEFCQRARFEAFKRDANQMLVMLSEIHKDVEAAAGIRTSALTSLDQTIR
jgi:hypothetical protein